MSWFDVDSAFAEMEALSRQVDALLGQGAGDGRRGLRTAPGNLADPSFTEDGDELVWRADLPGTPKEEVEIKLENGVLSVDARRRDEAFEGKTPRHRERRGYELHRSWNLPDTVDPDSVQASVEDGVLTVRLHRLPAPTPRRIAVS
jgi:HSP20 family protein